MRIFCFDTNVILHVIKGRSESEKVKTYFENINEDYEQIISVVSIAEINVLATRNNWEQRKRKVLTDYLKSFIVIPIYENKDLLSCYEEIDIYSQKYPKGPRNMGKNDLWIASTAMAADATLLTFDKDFNHLSPALIDLNCF